jgi:2-polyprenyl-6-hydroxyphenyl methylase/3-demethylubiquinone-9 3-methyltransferase
MSANTVDAAVYGHCHETPASEGYLYPELLRLLAASPPTDKRLFEIGVGSGFTARDLCKQGFEVAGIEPSADGVALARQNAPDALIEAGSAYDDLASKYGRFQTVFALEVIEHLYSPRLFAKSAFDLLEDGGHLIVSTPFHGYFKNLMLAATGKLDDHFTALWDHGHIKFWSRKTLGALLEEAGFRNIQFSYAGRFYPISRSFFACAQR